MTSDRPSLASSEMKNLWRRSPALASLVWRGLYCRQLENIRSTSETKSPEEEQEEKRGMIKFYIVVVTSQLALMGPDASWEF